MSHSMPPGHGPEHEHDRGGFLHSVRERLISVRTMDRPLRLASGLAVAWLLAAALLIALRDHGPHGPSTSVYAVDGQLVTMHVPVLVASIVLLAFGWAYVLAGAVHAHWALRLLGLGVFSWAMWDEGLVPHEVGGWAALSWLLLAGVWLVAGAAHLYDLRVRRRGLLQRSHMTRLVLLTAATLFLLCGGLYLVSWLSLRTQGPLLFTEMVSAQLSSISVVLIPILVVAGSDFADFGAMAAGFVARGVVGLRGGRRRLLPAVVAAGAAATVAWQLWTNRHGLSTLGQEAATAVVAALLLALVVRAVRLRGSTQRFARHVPYAAVALLAVFSFSVTYLYLYLPGRAAAESRARQDNGRVDALLGPYNHEGDPAFSVEHPQLWETTVQADRDGLTLVRFDGLQTGDPALMWILSATPQQLKDTTSALTTLLVGMTGAHGPLHGQVPYLASAHRQGDWEVFEVSTYQADAGVAPMQGRIWTRTSGGRAWVLFGLTYRNLWQFNQPGFAAIAGSWQPQLRVEAPTTQPSGGATDSDRAVAVDVGVLLLSAVVMLVATRRRRLRGRGGWSTAALFAGVVAALELVAVPGPLLRVATGSAHGLVGLHIEGIQLVAGAAALAWLAWLLLRRRIGAATRPLVAVGTLLLGLQVVSWVYGLFSNALDASGRFSIAQAVILVVALLWDIAMSGETLTNGGNRLVPRHARVALYFGYVLLTVVNILYFSSLQMPVSGAQVEAQFESDAWVQSGVIILGIPLLLTMFLVELRGWWDERAVGAPPLAGEEAAA